MPSRKRGSGQRSKPEGANRTKLKARLLRLPKRARLQEMAAQLNSDDPMTRREVADVFKSFLSKGGGVQADEIIALGVIPRFVEFLQCHDDPILQIEASMILNSIVTSDKPEHTASVVDAQAVPHLVELLKSTNETANLQAAWVLNNIASESVACRDKVVAEGSMTALLKSMQEIPFPEAGQLALKTQLSALLSFCGDRLGDRSKLPMEVISPALSVLKDILERQDPKPDDEVLSMVCSVVSCISKDGEDESIGRIVDACLSAALVGLLKHRNPRVQAAAVRALGNLVSGDDERHTQSVLDCGALPSLLDVLRSSNHLWETRSDICWMLSNIAVGSLEQIQLLIDSGLIPTLVKLLEDQTDHLDVRTEAAWVVSNSAASGCRKQVSYLAQEGCIRVLSSLLVLNDDCDLEMVNGVLHALENILEAGAAEAAAEAARLAGVEPPADDEECQECAAAAAAEASERPEEAPERERRLKRREEPPVVCKTAEDEDEEGAQAEEPPEAEIPPQAEILPQAACPTETADAAQEQEGAEDEGESATATEEQEALEEDAAETEEGTEELSGEEAEQAFIEHKVHGAPAASSALPYVPNQYAVMLEQCGGVERISSFLALSEEYAVVESARRILENHFGMKKTASEVSLHCAAHDGSLECAVHLIEKKADVDAQDCEGRSPLAIASSLGHLELVQELVKSSANINSMDRMQATPVRLSAANGYKEITRFLIKSLKEQDERKKECAEEERRQQEEEARKQREALLGVVQRALEGRPCDWAALKASVDAAAKHAVQAQPVQLASRLLSARTQLASGTEGHDKERLLSGMEQLKRAKGMLGGEAADEWLGELSDKAATTLKWLHDESNAVATLRQAMQAKDAERLSDEITKAEALQAELHSERLISEITSAKSTLLKLSEEIEAHKEMREALESVHTKKLAEAITKAEKCGLNAEAEEGRKALKKVILSAKKELQHAVASRQVELLEDTINKVEELSVESLSGDLEAARKAAQTIELEATVQRGLAAALLGLQEACAKGTEEAWNNQLSQVEEGIEKLRSLGLKKQVEQARADLDSVLLELETRKLLQAAVAHPPKLQNAISTAKRNKMGSKLQGLIQEAEAALQAAVGLLATEMLEAIQAQDEEAVQAVMSSAKTSNMDKALMAQADVKAGLQELKKAKAAEQQLAREAEAERRAALRKEEEARKAAERKEAEQKQQERKEAERKDKERREAERKAQQLMEEEARKEEERKEKERKEVEQKEKEEAERLEAEQQEAEQLEAQQLEAQRLERLKMEAAEAASKEAECHEKALEEAGEVVAAVLAKDSILAEMDRNQDSLSSQEADASNSWQPDQQCYDDTVASHEEDGEPLGVESSVLKGRGVKPEKRRRKEATLQHKETAMHKEASNHAEAQEVWKNVSVRTNGDPRTVSLEMPDFSYTERNGRGSGPGEPGVSSNRVSSRLVAFGYPAVGGDREPDKKLDNVEEKSWVSDPETPSRAPGVTVDSPSEDAFIQSILGELDMDME